MNRGFGLVILFTKAMRLDGMLQRIKPLLPAAKVVMIYLTARENIETGEMSIGRKSICGCDVMVSELEGLGILWPPVPERMNCNGDSQRGFGSRG